MNLIVFEDEHLLVINKPAGLNTHSPAPHAGEGVYDWLRNREARWANLAIIHRLDKETSGLLLFSKTPLANRSLTDQFTRRVVRKKYVLATDRTIRADRIVATSMIERAGPKYISRPIQFGGTPAETRFRVLRRERGKTFSEAEPITGRTHQIRVHAAENGFPIFGDTIYGGSPAKRVWLHAEHLTVQHPASGRPISFAAPAEFDRLPSMALRETLIDSGATDAYRLLHGAADGEPGFYIDRLSGHLLAHSATTDLTQAQSDLLHLLMDKCGARGVYHKQLSRRVGRQTASESSPRHVFGEEALDTFFVRENKVQFELSFREGYSVGLFLDQRDNRHRILTGYIAPGLSLASDRPSSVLNAFAYTCGFSVCAALAGARVTSLDLSKKYLEWGRRNFQLNGLDPAAHDFIYGDAFDWMRRLEKKQRQYHLVLLDPPTFSRTKNGGVFQAEKDYAKLISAALPLVKANGVLFASTNAARLEPEKFVEIISAGIKHSGRVQLQMHYQPQPPDFPVSRDEPAYLKTVWVRIG